MRHDATGDHVQLLVLRAMHAEVHNFLLWGHLGQEKMRENAFYWSGIWEGCNNWVTKCNECARVKIPPNRPREPLGEILGEMSVRASFCSSCRMSYNCSTCDYNSELYH